jgi:hypothetical protein
MGVMMTIFLTFWDSLIRLARGKEPRKFKSTGVDGSLGSAGNGSSVGGSITSGHASANSGL